MKAAYGRSQVADGRQSPTDSLTNQHLSFRPQESRTDSWRLSRPYLIQPPAITVAPADSASDRSGRPTLVAGVVTDRSPSLSGSKPEVKQ
jgi:hypothetical protein